MTPALAVWLAREALAARRVLRLGPDQLDVLARRRLARMLVRAQAAPFQARRLRAAGGPAGLRLLEREPFTALAALEPVGKAELREAGDDVLAGGRVDPRWYSSASSGSTGEPFRVHYDPRSWILLKYLVKLRARAACGVRPTDRVALLDAIPVAEQGRLPLERLGRLARISVLQPAGEVAAALAAFQPDAIYGLPSALLEAAGELLALGERVAPVGIFTSGELLQPAVRRALAGGFGAPVFDVYGTSETKEIAWECREGGRHINSDVVRVDVLDAAGAPALPGEEGDLVVSLLVNDAMPILRYRTGDRGALLPHPCRCGLALPLLGVVAGRTADTLELADGRRVSPYALTCALEQVEELHRYQVTQLERMRLRVRAIVPAATDRATTELRIRDALHDGVSRELVIDVEYVDQLATGARSKLRVVEPWRSAELM